MEYHAGGAISRSVRGWDDLKGYWTQTDTIPNEDSEYIWYSVYHDRKDYEPDIFIIILMDFPVSFMRIRAREVQV